jgi:hypothetical protein
MFTRSVFLLSLDVLARFARARVFSSRPVDHLSIYLPRLWMMPLLPQRDKSCPSIERAKTQSGRRVYTRLLCILLRVCLRVCFFFLVVSASAGGDCNGSTTRGIYIRGGIIIDGRETRPLSGSKRSTWNTSIWSHVYNSKSLATLHLATLLVLSVSHSSMSLLPRCRLVRSKDKMRDKRSEMHCQNARYAWP